MGRENSYLYRENAEHSDAGDSYFIDMLIFPTFQSRNMVLRDSNRVTQT